MQGGKKLGLVPLALTSPARPGVPCAHPILDVCGSGLGRQPRGQHAALGPAPRGYRCALAQASWVCVSGARAASFPGGLVRGPATAGPRTGAVPGVPTPAVPRPQSLSGRLSVHC